MPIDAFLALTTIAIALWIRRLTWRSNIITPAGIIPDLSERAITLNVALQGVAVILMLPLTGHTIGHWLYKLTGEANLTNLIAHDCYIVAASMILMTGLDLQIEGAELRRKFRQRVEYPCTAVIPILTALFLKSSASDHPVDNFFAAQSDIYLTAYWILLCGVLAYSLLYAVFIFTSAVPQLRTTGYKVLVTAYTLSSSCGLIATSYKVVGATVGTDAATAPFVWLFATLCGTGFAVATGTAWHLYQHAMAKPGPNHDMIVNA